MAVVHDTDVHHRHTLPVNASQMRVQVGVRSREWTSVAQSEVGVIRELARCLRLIREGRVPA